MKRPEKRSESSSETTNEIVVRGRVIVDVDRKTNNFILSMRTEANTYLVLRNSKGKPFSPNEMIEMSMKYFTIEGNRKGNVVWVKNFKPF